MRITKVSDIEMSAEQDPFRCDFEGCNERVKRSLREPWTQCGRHA